MALRILITGATGQVGNALSALSWPENVEIVMASREVLNLSDATAIGSFVTSGGFDAVINPAAYTAVDRAESDVLTAWKVNALAPAILAEATRNAGIPLLHVSTDYVFDGSKIGAYVEHDAINPVGVYAASKAAGELAVRASNPRHIILRTSWVFSAHGTNFVKTMLRVGAKNSLVRVVDDQQGRPTSARDIAATIAAITLKVAQDPAAPTGTFHFANAGAVTWCGFARGIFQLQAQAGYRVPEIKAIPTTEYPTPAKRPANSVLNTDKLSTYFGIHPRPWKDALIETLAELNGQQP